MNFKLFSAFVFLLAICMPNQSKPMNWLSNFNNSDSPVVTEPYQPSFSARHPKISNLLKSSALGGFAALCAHQQDSDYSLRIGAAAFAAIFAYNAFKKPPVLDSLLINPSEVLHQIDSARNKFQQIGDDKLGPEEQRSIYKKIKKETKKEFPLFLLGECTQTPMFLLGMRIGEGCALRRAYQPDYRKIYEDRVLAALASKSKILQQPIQYTSFGCGGMLQDLVIITKFLAQNPDAKIDVHLIDRNHTPYCGIRDLLNKDLKLEPKEKTDLEPKMSEIIALTREKWGGKKDSDDKIKNGITIEYIQNEDKGKQFISFLRKTFPKAQTSLFLHATTNNYFTYLENHNIPYSDIVTTADIMDEMSLMNQSQKNYGLLCIKTLQHKPESTNIWLEKNLEMDKLFPTEAGIISISLENPDNINIKEGEFDKGEFELDEKNKISFYIKTDNITKSGWVESIIKRLFGIFGY